MGGLCGGPRELLVLIGAASVFLSETSVEPDDADMIVRGTHHGTVWGSMGFGGFGHPSCADE